MKQKLVLPGEFLSTEEEFSAGKNAFECEGSICSDSAGFSEQDARAKEVSVKPIKPVQRASEGQVVYGRVSLVKENSVSMELYAGPGQERVVFPQGNAMLPIRNVSRDYVEKLRDCFRIGDIVKARISRMLSTATDVSTNEQGLGVVKAFCTRCRKPLHLFGTSLRCLSCGSSETRKMSDDYMVK